MDSARSDSNSIDSRDDLVMYTYTGTVNSAASPLFSGSFDLRAQFDLTVAPTLSQVLPNENRYTMTAVAHQLKITGAPGFNGAFTSPDLVWTAADESPPSADLDSLSYTGSFLIYGQDFKLKLITFFADPSVYSSIASSPPVFDPSDAFLIIATHTVDDGTEYNFNNRAVDVAVVPVGTGLPEPSSIAFLAMTAVVGLGLGLRRRYKRLA
jgi:hypothetical protein